MAGRLHAGHGWQMLIAGILAWEVWCEEGELLSQGFDRLLKRHPVWPRIVVVLVAAHLINWLPERVDPLTAASKAKGWRRWLAPRRSSGIVN